VHLLRVCFGLIIYQALFAIPEGDSPGNPSHRAFQFGHLSGSPPDNPWNPDGGNYQFVYYLPCTYKDNCGNPTSGYLGYTCATNAPVPVLQALFGPNSSIDLNPLELFMGFNGWPPVVDYTTLTTELITIG
jgi:hypothetical protein